MAHPLVHCKSSVKKFGGIPEDYIDIHNWFDENFDRIFGKKKKDAYTSPHLIEYELNKSTGELDRLYEGTSKPSSEQFDGE